MTASTVHHYLVHETWQSDPVGDERDGRWVYDIVRDGEHIAEHRWYASAKRQADQLNAQLDAQIAKAS